MSKNLKNFDLDRFEGESNFEHFKKKTKLPKVKKDKQNHRSKNIEIPDVE